MWVAQGSKIRRRGRRLAGPVMLGIVIALAGCERTPEPVATADGAKLGVTQPALAAPAPTAEAQTPNHAHASPFELMGTGTNDSHSFAVLEQSGHRLFTVREGDKIEGYTIASIEPDRVKVTSPENDEEVLVAANKAASVRPSVPANPATAAAPGASKLITEGVNTDQSIPTNVTFGPTGYDPNNGRQMGH